MSKIKDCVLPERKKIKCLVFVLHYTVNKTTQRHPSFPLALKAETLPRIGR